MMAVRSIALLGGSFDPPHLAHQMLCLWALSTRFEAVWLVPTFVHALGKPLTNFSHRTGMCELALEPFAPPRVAVCRIEAELSEPSRTLFTVEALCARHPELKFSLLVGADILAQQDEWYRFDELERLVEVVAVGRMGHRPITENITLPDISSSRIRDRLQQGEDVSSYLPAAVYRYIVEHGLYKEGHR